MTIQFFDENSPIRYNAKEAIKQADLMWTVASEGLYLEDGTKIATHKALLRGDNRKLLSVVGNKYTPYHNEYMAEWCDFLLAEHDCEIVGAGHFGSKRVFLQLRLKSQEGSVGKDDALYPYFLISNSHDGSFALKFTFTVIRVICRNTLTIAQSSSDKTDASQRSFRHTASIKENAEDIRKFFDLSTASFNQSLEVYSSMENVDISMKAFNQYVSSVFNKEHNKMKNYDQLWSSFNGGVGNGNHGRTLWDAYNSITEFTAHHQKSRTKEARLNSNWFGNGARIRDLAFDKAVAILKG